MNKELTIIYCLFVMVFITLTPVIYAKYWQWFDIQETEGKGAALYFIIGIMCTLLIFSASYFFTVNFIFGKEKK